MKSFYPEEVSRRLRFPSQCGVPKSFDSKGTGVSLECGSAVRFYLTFSGESITQARFVSNGCGWAVASSEALAELVVGKRLKDLHGLAGLSSIMEQELGHIPGGRRQCVAIAGDALKTALADHRERIVCEWTGDKALVCSCFGVSEETIEEAAAAGTATTIEEVGELCGAGTGCGSCRMIIGEILRTED